MRTTGTTTATGHSVGEDLLGLVTGVVVVSFGLFVLKSGGVVTGGTAGLSLLLSYAVPVPFGVVFFVVNLPFFVLGARKKGWSFTVRSGASVLAVSALSLLHPLVLDLSGINTLYAALLGNTLCGVGLLILFRHDSSLGGFNIVALWLQEKRGVRAGYVLMALDLSVVALSLTVVHPLAALVSALGAVLLDLILALNHRPGRYSALRPPA